MKFKKNAGTWGKNAGDFIARLNSAFLYRKGITEKTSAYRIVNGAFDGFPGMTLDVYEKHFQIQFFTPEMIVFEDAIVEAVCKLFSPDYLIIKYRLSPSGADLSSPKMRVVCGENASTIVREGNCRFQVNLSDTVNPGLFLDMREMRLAIACASRGRSILNLFSYTCSFGAHARVNGAKSSVNVDISGKILEKGKANYVLNGLEILPGEFFRGNAFEYLELSKRKGKKFDIIVLDPPSFARHKGFSFNVRDDFDTLVANASSILLPGGILMASSNYSGFQPNAFARRVQNIVEEMCRGAQILKQSGQGRDFPGSGETKNSCLCAVMIQTKKEN